MTETTIINIRDAPKGWKDNPDYVYIGRFHKSRKYGVLWKSKWYNPYKDDGSVARFEEYLKGNEQLMRCLPELQGKTLVCWCVPAPCHGEVIARLVNGK